MKSPRADASLITRTIDSVELDVCPDTGGVWFDHGELSKLADTPEYADRALIPWSEIPDAGLGCPRCAMASGAAGAHGGDGADGARAGTGTVGAGGLMPCKAGDVFLVHRCPVCRGVWADGDVVRAIAGRVADGNDESEVADIEREAELHNKSLAAEQAVDAVDDIIGGSGLLSGLSSLLGRLF